LTIILKQIFAFLKLLNSEKGTNQIAAGIACGLILGFSPTFSLQSVLVFICLFAFRIQMGAAFIFAFFFAFIAYLLDPVCHMIGSAVLETESLVPYFTTLYHMPIVPFTRFNNSIVMGSGILAIALSPVMFVISKILISKYREKVVARFQNSKFWKVIQSTSLFKWYVKYDKFFGK